MTTPESRITRLEERQANIEQDVSEIKAQLNQTATKSDVQDLKRTIESRDDLITKNLWKLIWILIAVFTGIVAINTGLNLSDLQIFGG